jgi:hypothetical protein
MDGGADDGSTEGCDEGCDEGCMVDKIVGTYDGCIVG